MVIALHRTGSQWTLCFNWMTHWANAPSMGGTLLMLLKASHNQISRTHSTEASPAALSRRHSSDFTLLDSRVILLTLASCLCVSSYLRARETGVWSMSHVTNNLFPHLASGLFIDCPQENTWRFSAYKPQIPQKTLSVKNLNSRYGVVSFKLNWADINGVASVGGNHARSHVHW